jgi:hypothetical protein
MRQIEFKSVKDLIERQKLYIDNTCSLRGKCLGEPTEETVSDNLEREPNASLSLWSFFCCWRRSDFAAKFDESPEEFNDNEPKQKTESKSYPLEWKSAVVASRRQMCLQGRTPQTALAFPSVLCAHGSFDRFRPSLSLTEDGDQIPLK